MIIKLIIFNDENNDNNNNNKYSNNNNNDNNNKYMNYHICDFRSALTKTQILIILMIKKLWQ